MSLSLIQLRVILVLASLAATLATGVYIGKKICIAYCESSAVEAMTATAESNAEDAAGIAESGARVSRAVEQSRVDESSNRASIAEVLANEQDFASMRRPPDLQRVRSEERDAIASAAMSSRNPGASRGTNERAREPDDGRE